MARDARVLRSSSSALEVSLPFSSKVREKKSNPLMVCMLTFQETQTACNTFIKSTMPAP